MNLALLVVLLGCSPSVGEGDAEAILDRAVAELSRVEDFDTSYHVEVRVLLSTSVDSKTQELAEKRRYKEDPTFFLRESDPGALKNHGGVRFVRRREEFLVVMDDFQVRSGPGFSTGQIAIGESRNKKFRFRSKRIYDSNVRGPLKYQISKAWVGGASDEDEMLGQIIDPEVPCTLISQSRMVKSYLLSLPQIPPSGPNSVRLSHKVDRLPELKPGEFAVRSWVDDKRVPKFRGSRLMIFPSPNRHLPDRVEIAADGKLRHKWILQWDEFPDRNGQKVAFPTYVRQESYTTRRGLNVGKLYRVATLRVDPKRTKVNAGVSDADLAFSFPIGTVVSDQHTGDQYTVTGSGNEDVYLDGLWTSGGSIIPRKNRMPEILVGSTFFIIVVGAFWIHKRRGPSKRRP